MLGLAWKSLVWFLAGVAVALGFLLVPLQVAAERKKLDRTAAEIVRAQRDIRALETEFETRASLAQLDRYNADSLRLVAPSADQFVSDEQALAAIDVRRAPGDGAVQIASFVPAGPVAPAVAGQPPATTSAPVAVPAEALGPEPVVRTPARTAQASVSRRHDVALLDRALLDDSMIGDLRSSASAEIGAGRIGVGR